MYDPIHSCIKMNGIKIYVGKLRKRRHLSTLSYPPVETPVQQGNNKMAVTCLRTLNLRIKDLQQPKKIKSCYQSSRDIIVISVLYFKVSFVFGGRSLCYIIPTNILRQ